MHIDTLTFRASLYNVGLGKKARYFLIQTLIADCDTRLVCLKLFWMSHPRVVEATIEGQSTFGMERTKGGKVEKLQIVEGASTLRWKPIYFIPLNNVCNCKIFLLFSPLNSQESFGSQGVKRVTLWDQLAAHQLWRLRVGDAGKLDWTAGCYEQGVV